MPTRLAIESNVSWSSWFLLFDFRSPVVSSPHRSLLRPARIVVAAGERLRRLGERRGVAAPLVARHPRPVESFGRGIAVSEPLHHLPEPLLGLRPLLIMEGGMTESQHQLRQELLRRQETFDPMLLLTL